MKRTLYSILIMTLCLLPLASPLASPLQAQSDGSDIQTADQFFRQISEHYANIKDYEAAVTVRSSRQPMSGAVIYKSPTLMRMDFSQPAEQVIIYNGSELLVYVPEFRAVLRQQTSSSGASAAAIASSDGLRMLSRSYTITYVKGPTPEPLDAGSEELVVNLLLTRRTVAEGFRTITLSINPTTKMIRRMQGVSLAGETITLDFTNIRINTGVTDTKFIYEYPTSANSYHNFLFNAGN